VKEAHDQSRITPLGKELGAQIARMTEKVIAQLANEGEPDDRCGTCAFRLGTVPNGCPQTLMDAVKAVMEGVTFLCHNDPARETVCHGYYAARVAMKGETVQCPWSFSEPDKEVA